MANPALSVIIPMYNAEENIGECLDSLFAQTFQDFEVIVVDDCSTDNSVKIVESYAPKFNGRLHITHTEKNSGNSAIPSNLALEIAQGEYVIFVDSNDFLLATALETFYTAAEEYEADVVYTSAFYDIRQPNDVYLLRDGAGKKMLEDGRIDKPVLTIDNPDKNLRLLLTKEREGNFCYTWTKFVRRDFLLENEITFPVISNGADFIWNINVYCHAKKFLRIPMPLYFYRRYKTQSQVQRELREQVLYGISEFITWTKLLDELESKNKILSDNPAYCLAAMKSHFERLLSRMDEARDQLSAKEFYGILFNKLIAEKNLSDETVSSLLSLINVDNLASRGVRQVLEDAIQADPKFLNKFTARVDVKFISQQKSKGDFQILNVSDVKATVDKPAWLQRGGIGYQIQSYVGKLEFIAKADTNGQIKVSLKVKDIRELGDKTKRIPCWIGYTSLTVNGNEAFDTVALAWHDKSYIYNIEVRAGEEVKIQIEWLLPKEILKNVSTDLAEPLPFPKLTDPAISVIIPMYNAAEYVGECLDSLLLQTFRNFEVIVVDDCSTDDSVKIVEGYAPKFEGRLQITQTETNSGGCAIPRNVGFPLSRGEYVFFMDADDIIIETAFEEVYALAKKYNAEIVYCEKYYMSEGVGQKFKDNIHIAESRIQKPPFVVEPTLESYDLEERVKKLLQWNYWMTAWLKFVRRDLLIEHNIKFPPTFISEDDIWSLKLLFCSKRFLRIPTPYYVRRIREDSIMGRDRNALDQIKRWLDVIIRCLKDLDNFMGGIEFFRDNPRYRYEILDRSLNASFGSAFDKLKDESDANLYSIFQQNFGEYLGDNDVLVSALCARAITQRKDLENEKRYAQDIQRRVTLKEAELEHLKAKLEFISPLAPLQSDVPAISVIIPMYNVEKYIGECLDCLVMQTFQDFEVIVVDDCSTDSSFFAAKRYLPKFNGRLRIVKTEENSGGGGIPRNLGLELAKGEYILFVDADDFILWNTLEILYTAAKKYDTDVVYTSAYYLLYRPNEIRTIRDGIGSKLLKENLEDETNLIVDDQNKLLQQLVFERAFNFAVMHFVRRDFLLQNNIVFTKIFNGEDHLWVIQVCCHSKRFFRTTTPFYFYRRYDSGSISVQEREPDEQISHWILGFSNWLKLLNALENKEQILKDNPAYCFAAAKRNFEWCLNRINNARDKISNEEICDVLYHAFANESDNLVVPFLFSILDQRTRETAQLKQQIAEQQAEFRDVILIITARIDIQFVPKTGRGDFQILSVFDDKANVDKPAWFQKGGIGYQIESFARKMEIVAKVTTDGRINMKLRGVDVSNPADKSKRVPYWIDYTKLTINGKKVIDKLTPAWHGKPYNYSFDAKANAEIKIEVEWLPHKNDT